MPDLAPVLINDQWRPAAASGTFQAENPALAEPLPDAYPISSWADCQEALVAATRAKGALRKVPPARLAQFLERYAERLEAAKPALVEMAHLETALPTTPRLADVEFPRTTQQLRLAAAAARTGDWRLPTIDSKANIRSCFDAIGPVVIFGPNNFPFAFNGAAGGDFAAAIAAGNPVIVKANSSHPGVTRMLALEAHHAAGEAEMPPGVIQLLYRTSHDDGERLVADPRVGAVAYTGSRAAGLKLKAAADSAGTPIYLELSSVNPVLVLPGALRERAADIAGEFVGSCLMGTGQFCTNPGLVLVLAGPETEAFVALLAERFQAAPVGTLLSRGVSESLARGIAALRQAGADVLAGGTPGGGRGYSHANTLLRATGRQFLARPVEFQTEAFGNASLLVVCDDADELAFLLDRLEGNLTGCIYSDRGGGDDKLYESLAPLLRARVGRLLNDKMPTGVAVSPAMNHGGPFPATGHPGFTAVGIPASLRRFAMLQCYDNVRPERLPAILQPANPLRAVRNLDGAWTPAEG